MFIVALGLLLQEPSTFPSSYGFLAEEIIFQVLAFFSLKVSINMLYLLASLGETAKPESHTIFLYTCSSLLGSVTPTTSLNILPSGCLD